LNYFYCSSSLSHHWQQWSDVADYSKQQQSSFQQDNITTHAVPPAMQMTKTGTKATAEQQSTSLFEGQQLIRTLIKVHINLGAISG
jgi:hypothetical protein